MRRRIVWVGFLLLVGCASEEIGSLLDDPNADAEGGNEIPGECTDAHVAEGAFTNLGGPPECEEWRDNPGCAHFAGDLYLEYLDGVLHALLDWRQYSDEPVSAEAFARFHFIAGGGAEQWQVTVHGNGLLHVTRNGWEYGEIAPAGAGFGPSKAPPETDRPIFEWSLPVVTGTLRMAVDGPGPNGSVVADPLPYGLEVAPGEILTCPGGRLGTEPGELESEFVLIGATPPRGVEGTVVELRGFGFGTQPGRVFMGSQEATVVSWQPMRIVVEVPAITEDVLTYVKRGSVESNRILFYYDCTVDCGDDCDPEVCPGLPCGICPPPTICVDGMCACLVSCAGRVCGDDGCGGSCGTCAAGESCLDGQCECVPQCPDALGSGACGPDGCGGFCGVCADTDVCHDGSCCTPACADKQCGADACGGTCGTCPETYACQNGSCVCQPQCAGKTCGDDGCGGQCGVCVDDWQCIEGQCQCVPDCVDKTCGDDGCGGECGECPEGLECTKIGKCELGPSQG